MNQPHGRALLARKSAHRVTQTWLDVGKSGRVGSGKDTGESGAGSRLRHPEQVARRVVEHLHPIPMFPGIGKRFAKGIRHNVHWQVAEKGASEPGLHRTHELLECQIHERSPTGLHHG